MTFPIHFTQTDRATSALGRMAADLESCADALRAVLAGTHEDCHLNTLREHMTGDAYGLSFNGFGEARCPSCGAIDWTCGKGDTAEGLCPSCANSCRKCGEPLPAGFSSRCPECSL